MHKPLWDQVYRGEHSAAEPGMPAYLTSEAVLLFLYVLHYTA